ncbi:MAG: TetR/AcrR family transcriptional regulator [Sphingopyxis sp.]
MARPSKPLISRRNAAEAALAVIDEHGLDGFNLALVARQLGVKAPSLYHHFRDKNEILAEVARIILRDVPPLHPADSCWQERLIARCIETRRTLLRHPKAAGLILHQFPRHLLLSAYDVAASEQTGEQAIRMAVIEGAEKITYGSALFGASARADGVPLMPLVDAAEYPALSTAIAHNPFDDEALFVEVLRMFLIGAETRARAGQTGQPIHSRADAPPAPASATAHNAA